MLDPFENILIGNFLYSLGLVIGNHSLTKSLPGCVNLLQQTPLDPTLGDVFLAYPGVVRLIEFKREKNRDPKESRKRSVLEGALKSDPYLLEVSRRVHWYIKSAEAPLEWSTEICPYIDFESGERCSSSLRAFVEQIAGAALNASEPEFPPKDIASYLRAISLSSKRDGSSSGLLVSIDKTGSLRHIAVENLRDLTLDLSIHVEQANVQSQQMAFERDRALAQGLTPDKGPSYDR